jgi:hypothetical protein
LATATPSAQFIPTLAHAISSHNRQTFELRPTFVPFHVTPRADKTIFFSISDVLTHSEGFPSGSLHAFLPSRFLKLSLLAPSLGNPSFALHNSAHFRLQTGCLSISGAIRSSAVILHSLANFGFSGMPKSTMPFNRTNGPARSVGFSIFSLPQFHPSPFLNLSLLAASLGNPSFGLHNSAHSSPQTARLSISASVRPSTVFLRSLTNFGFSELPKSTLPFSHTDARAHSLDFSGQAPLPFSAESLRFSETISCFVDSPRLTLTATGPPPPSDGSTGQPLTSDGSTAAGA